MFNSIVDGLILFFGWLIFIYMAVVILTYSMMLFAALLQLKKEHRLDKNIQKEDDIVRDHSLPVTIIVPAYNEEVGIIDSVSSLLSLHYAETELIVVNDGSTDKTQEKLIEYFEMVHVPKVIRKQLQTKPILNVYQSKKHPHLWLIEKENGGKADALNAGINMSRYPYFCSIDGDSLLDESSLLRVMNPLRRKEVIAAGGNVRIANGNNIHMGSVFQTRLSDVAIVVMQVIEYFRAFLMGRIALSRFNLNLIISGAFSVFQKEFVIQVGGYSKHMIGEDMELVVKLHRYIKENNLKKRIEFVPDPVCWTEAPESFSILRRQRRRWQQGLMESLWKHKRMTFNPKYGLIGILSFPYYWLVEALGPIIEFGGYIYLIVAFFLGNIYFEFAVALLLLFILYGTIFSIASILLDAWALNSYPKVRDVTRLVIFSLSEVFWYKPLTLFWRMEGIVSFLLKRSEWGDMKRIGLAKKELAK